jgi:hypothetical protein
MVVEPATTEVAIPDELITAVLMSEESHVACRVRLIDEPSLNWPVAVNCWVPPTAMPGLLGVTVMDVSVAPVVFTVDVPTKPPKTAVIVVWAQLV